MASGTICKPFDLITTTNVTASLDDMFTPGLYYVESNAGIPAGSNGTLLVINTGSSGNRTVQFFMRFGTAGSNDNTIAWRRYSGFVWGRWWYINGNDSDSRLVKSSNIGGASLLLSSLNWVESGSGMYYAIIDTSNISGTFLSVNINYWRAIKATDFIQPYFEGNGIALLANVNTFSNNAAIGLKVTYI